MIASPLIAEAYAHHHVLMCCDPATSYVQGEIPSNDETVALFHLLSQANVDLRQPVSLEQQLMEDSDMEAEVGLAMVQLLKVRLLAMQYHCPSALKHAGLVMKSKCSYSRSTTLAMEWQMV